MGDHLPLDLQIFN